MKNSQIYRFAILEDSWICTVKGLNLEQIFIDYANLTSDFSFNIDRHIGDDEVTKIELYDSPFREIIVDILEIVLSHSKKTPQDISEMKIVPIKVFEHLTAQNQYFLVLRFRNKQVTFIPFDLITYFKLGLQGLRELVLLKRLKRVFNVEPTIQEAGENIIEVDI